MAYQNLESILQNLMTKQKLDQNRYDVGVRQNDTAFGRGMANRQMSLAEQQALDQKIAANRQMDQADKDEEMDATDWIKFILGMAPAVATTIAGAATGNTAAAAGGAKSLLNTGKNIYNGSSLT